MKPKLNPGGPMIRKIDHKSTATAKMIHCIFQRSYAIEAKLLDSDDFPPLKRSAKAIQKSQTDFYGYFSQQGLCAVVELEFHKNRIHIRSLTVDPQFFRQGIGRHLLDEVRNRFKAPLLTVETGHANLPAVSLYLNYGFEKDRIFMTEAGIEKISFKMSRKP